jgi:hypothetical protein
VSTIIIVDTIDPDQPIKPIILCAPSLRQTAVTPRLRQGLSLNKISQTLFREGHRTLKGSAFSAAQVRLFMRFSGET